MCGRARCTLHREEIAEMAGVKPEAFVDGDKYRPCENMGPGRYGPVTFRGRDGGAHGGRKGSSAKHTKLQAMRWGLIPSFTKPHVKPDHFIMFNARSESLQERPAFRRLLETKRCVVFSDGYYEWRQIDKKEKQPYYLHSTADPLKFAGLYDSWLNAEGETSYTYTMLTTEAPSQLMWMHPRIPVILTDEGVRRWLSDAKFDSLKDLLVGYGGEDLTWHPVDKRVGSTKFQSEDCSKKVDIKHAANITSFFGGHASKEHVQIAEPPGQDDVNVPLTSTIKSDPSPPSQTDSSAASESQQLRSSQEDLHSNRSQDEPPLKPEVTKAAASPARAVNGDRKEAFRSPIKFLFQQQQMVQQAEDIFAGSEGRTTASTSTSTNTSTSTSTSGQQRQSVDPSNSLMGTKRAASPIHPRSSPKKPKKVPPSPKKPVTKNPQRGTLLAYFQPKS